ncbi:NAD(P)-dependent dehydrogenase (short-subunit alcohol dehydrogenase family) [Runella defluvii]|uniref:NAD(P)-dependent dehydrogenase (Short-subunit alcohol dehydrogenase family) n=1 Tax=Runella defluvii TaxID=370973 RepID=A0A7W5ZKM0_9BACT|nr:SDR family oxidoreductase [Runella defluvii]MBB3838895.1 NAD(P)-dependent dehydrogenase (short-subunit alcohol dehydrogenase family) [Runella defluvii]
MSFQGKNILIIGASSGIGLAIAQTLQAEGASLFTASRRAPQGIQSQHSTWDVTQPVEGLFDALPDTLHGLVYAPGSINLKPFQRFSLADFQADFNVNVLGAVAAIQANLARLRKAGGASIVLFSTVAVQTGMGFHASIATAKGAVEGLTRSLAAELAATKIRCNAIAPSLTDTPLAASLLSSDEKREASNKRHPIGRVGTPQDLAAVAKLLLSDEGSWITGQVLNVDGGMGRLK